MILNTVFLNVFYQSLDLEIISKIKKLDEKFEFIYKTKSSLLLKYLSLCHKLKFYNLYTFDISNLYVYAIGSIGGFKKFFKQHFNFAALKGLK